MSVTVHRVTLDQPGQTPHGVCLYVGCPKSGKTTMMARHLAAWSGAGLPAAVLDPARVTPLEGYQAAPDHKAWAASVWTRRASAAYTPYDPPDEAAGLGGSIYQGGRCVVGLDELRAFVPVGRSVPNSMMAHLRLWRWRRIPYTGITTQCLGDFGRTLKSVVNFWYIFRLTEEEDQAAAGRIAKVPSDVIANIPQAMALRVRVGF